MTHRRDGATTRRMPDGKDALLPNAAVTTMVPPEERALAASARHFQLLIENAGDMVMRSDRDGKLTYISPAATRLTGFEPDELIGESSLSLVHPDDREAVWTTD